MGLLDSILRGLVRLICGDNDSGAQSGTQEVQPPQQPITVPPHRPQQRPPSTPSHYQRPEHVPVSHPASPPQKQRPSKPLGQRVDQNHVNQQNEYYTSLRARANEEGDQMSQAFEQSHQAYGRGDGALAKELSNKGKAHQKEMERLNAQASEWIYIENNKDSQPGEIDLHGLYVKEAISFTEKAIEDARRRGDTEIHLIVGKGLHSSGGVAKLKPAIEGLMQKHRLVAELDPHNAGVLIVSLDGMEHGIGQVMRPDDITRGLQSRDEGCLIM